MARSSIVFVGRLDEDTGLISFLKYLDVYRGSNEVNFVGDGPLRKLCERYGKVHGFIDSKLFLRKAKLCIPSGYLSYIEAKHYGCKIKVFWNNPLKKDYWAEIQKIEKFPSWDQIANEYLNLYNSKK
jgi:hypothetical protein